MNFYILDYSSSTEKQINCSILLHLKYKGLFSLNSCNCEPVVEALGSKVNRPLENEGWKMTIVPKNKVLLYSPLN